MVRVGLPCRICRRMSFADLTNNLKKRILFAGLLSEWNNAELRSMSARYPTECYGRGFLVRILILPGGLFFF
jgi:hypothetical protein